VSLVGLFLIEWFFLSIFSLFNRLERTLLLWILQPTTKIWHCDNPCVHKFILFQINQLTISLKKKGCIYFYALKEQRKDGAGLGDRAPVITYLTQIYWFSQKSSRTDWGQPKTTLSVLFMSPEGKKDILTSLTLSCSRICYSAYETVVVACWSRPSSEIDILDLTVEGRCCFEWWLSFSLTSILRPPHPCLLNHPQSESAKGATIALPLTV